MKVHEGQIEIVRFSGGELRAFRDQEGRIWVQAKPVAEALGLKWHGQLEHLQRDEALRDTIRIIRMVSPNPTNPRETIERETVFIERQGLVLWLAKLQPSRVKDPERRKKILAYQKEAAKALEDYFFRGAAVNPRAALDPGVLKTVVAEAVRRAVAEVRKAQEDPGLERIKLAQKLLENASSLPGVDPRWLQRMHEVVLYETLGLPLHDRKRTVDLSEFLRRKLGRAPERGELVSFGQVAARIYREYSGRPPEKRVVMLQGRETAINSYMEEDLPILETAFRLWAEARGIPTEGSLPELPFPEYAPERLN